MLELLVPLLATMDYRTSMVYAREIPFITEGNGIIVCDIHIYNTMTIPKLHSNQMLQITSTNYRQANYLNFLSKLKPGLFLTVLEMSVINGTRAREEFTIPSPIYCQRKVELRVFDKTRYVS